MGVATYLSPTDFLATLARRLRTTPERVPSSRATEELLSWIETSTAASVRPQPVFLHTAFRLVYKHARLVIGPNRDQIDALAERLTDMNAGRPQAAKWTRAHWRKLARLVLENRRLPVVTLFSDHPPTPEELIATVELPFAARYVDDPPDLDARRSLPARAGPARPGSGDARCERHRDRRYPGLRGPMPMAGFPAPTESQRFCESVAETVQKSH